MEPTKSITGLLDSLDFFHLFGVTEVPFFVLFWKEISEIIHQFKTQVSGVESQVSKRT